MPTSTAGPTAPAAGLDGDVDEVLAPAGGDAGTDGDGPGEDELGVDTLVDQPATADWAGTASTDPVWAPTATIPGSTTRTSRPSSCPNDFDDDIMDDVDDFHHDG